MSSLLIGVGKRFVSIQFKPTVQAYEEWIAKEKAKDGLSFEPT